MDDAPKSAVSPMNPAVNCTLGLGGAAAGGTLGHFTFGWLLQQGFYAPAVPGALLGLGCGLAVRRRSVPLAAVCGFLALALGIFTRWIHDASAGSESLGHFLARLHQLTPLTLIMLVLGAVAGFWFALGSRSKGVAAADPAKS